MDHRDHLFVAYWWLIFPIGWFVLSIVRTALRHSYRRSTLDLLRNYAAQGKEPPPEVLALLRGEHEAYYYRYRHRERGVGAWFDRQMHVTLVGGFTAARIDAHQLGALSLGFLRDAPKVDVAGDGIAAPNEDQFRLGIHAHLHADFATQRLNQAFTASAGANRAVEFGGTHAIEKTHGDGFALHQAHGARVAVGQEFFRALLDDGFEPLCDVGQGFLPTDALELATALGTCAFHRKKQTIRVVSAFGVARHLGAQHPVGHGVVGIALHFAGHTVLHGGDQRTGVRAIVRASAEDGGGRGFHVRWIVLWDGWV